MAAENLGHAVQRVGEFVEIALESVNALVDVRSDIPEGLVEERRDIFRDLYRSVQAPADHERNQAHVRRGQQVKVEHDELFDGGETQEEHRHEAVDRLLDTGRGQLVDALRHVMRHRRHGATHRLDRRACRKGFRLGGVEVVVQARDGDEDSDQDEKQENGPSVDPYLREAGTESEVWSD